MANKQDVLHELVRLARSLGRPRRNYVILDEGSVAARIGHTTLWVSAAGTRLHRAVAGGFIEMSFAGLLRPLDNPDLATDELRPALRAARADPTTHARPTADALLYALVLELDGVNFAALIRPPAVLSLLCSQNAPTLASGQVMVDEAGYCGAAPAFVPYAAPGLAQAAALRAALLRFADAHGQPPRVAWLQNHGLLALGAGPEDVENAVAMSVKAAEVLIGASLLGGPRFIRPRGFPFSQV